MSNMNCTTPITANTVWQPNAGDITNLVINVINVFVASASLYIAWLTYRTSRSKLPVNLTDGVLKIAATKFGGPYAGYELYRSNAVRLLHDGQ